MEQCLHGSGSSCPHWKRKGRRGATLAVQLIEIAKTEASRHSFLGRTSGCDVTFGPDAEHPSGRGKNIHGVPPPDVIHATRESASEVRSHIDMHPSD
ncbi:hypothetical protein LSAT2_000877 [Lamellibrachia satsuma]|nr:hypothetical protein LSAT2_000877 [Lamellibrachia satsuma]